MLQGTERLTDEEVKEKMLEVAKAIVKLDRQSQTRLVKALQYHKEAIDSQALENQLVDLWAALEGFVPQPFDDQPRIQHYISYLLPPLVLTYSEKIFKYIGDSLFHCDKQVRDVISGINVGESFALKAASVILCDEFAAERDKVCALLDDHPLLRFRMYRVYRQYHTAADCLETIKSHKVKLAWHLNRIYNTRNSIMHSATSLPYLETLVENLHIYLDILLTSVSQLAAKSSIRTDINAILKMLSVEERVYLSHLKAESEQGNASFHSGNFVKVVFGNSNPLVDIR
jgi:hypothetical protein